MGKGENKLSRLPSVAWQLTAHQPSGFSSSRRFQIDGARALGSFIFCHLLARDVGLTDGICRPTFFSPFSKNVAST